MTDRRLVRTLDLVDDAELMMEYRRRHAPGAVWPEVVAHIRSIGVKDMEIWCTGRWIHSNNEFRARRQMRSGLR
jgi:L-rhamnose mutarotase